MFEKEFSSFVSEQCLFCDGVALSHTGGSTDYYAALQVLMCLVSAGLGMWMGWVWAVSCPPYPINIIVPASKADYNHSHLLLSHLRPSLIKDYMR